jgi:Tfp pilus assembly protein FimT
MPIKFSSIHKKNLFAQTGFTIAEVVVSMGIIVLMTGFIYANYHTTTKKSELNLQAQQVASDIRLAQNNTLGLVAHSTCVPAIPDGGWGVHFDRTSEAAKKSYIIFADCNDNKTYDGGIELYKQIDLPKNIKIERITDSSSLSTGLLNTLDVTFFPPDPEVYINTLNNNWAEINLLNEATGVEKNVLVNIFGLIDVKEAVWLNSSSDDSCNNLCTTYGYTSCTDIGLDEQATDGKYMRHGPCSPNPGVSDCTAIMTNQSIMCNGFLAPWTFCKCSN